MNWNDNIYYYIKNFLTQQFFSIESFHDILVILIKKLLWYLLLKYLKLTAKDIMF